MPFSIAPTQANIQKSLRNFLIDILVIDPQDIIAAQVNRVPEPNGADFIVFTPLRYERLETDIETFDGLSSLLNFRQPTKVTMQLDIHGPNSAENASLVSTLFRSSLAVDLFEGYGLGVVPFYADDPKQLPFINAEQQYENRWVVEAAMQFNAQTSNIDQQSATTLDVGIISVDAEYPQ